MWLSISNQSALFQHRAVILLTASVTRFSEISPLQKKFTSLWQILDGLFLIWQNAEPALANL